MRPANPFDAEKKKEAEGPLRFLVGIGILGILVAGGLVLFSGTPEDDTPSVTKAEPILVGEGDVILHEEYFTRENPLVCPTYGTHYVVKDRTQVAYVEWVLPNQTDRCAYFLIEGIAEGRLQFEVAYKDGGKRIFEVEVQGKGKELRDKEQRMQALLDLKTSPKVYAKYQEYIKIGKARWRDRETPAKEEGYFVARQFYERAYEAVDVLKQIHDGRISPVKITEADADVEELRRNAKEEHEKVLEKQRRALDLLRKNEATVGKAEIVKEYKRFIRLIGDENSVEYRRHALILKRKYGQELRG